MDSGRRSLRVFISSPDDVRDEREATRRVVRRLANEFRHEFDLDEVMWEWQPLLAGYHFQTQIAAPSATDITVVILWGRLGTLLPLEQFPGPLSKAAVTGTEWEFEEAIASMRAKRTPDVLVYRKRDALLALTDSKSALEHQLAHLEMVEAFFRRWFASKPDGNVDVALRTFRTTAEFEQLVEVHLRKLLKQRVNSAATVVRWHSGSPYRGLRSFGPEHAEVFFGRDAANEALRVRLEHRLAERVPFVVVLGASGSGKSSLVKAGLIPSLEKGAWIGRIGAARRAILSPSEDENDPLMALARALLEPGALPELEARGFGDAQKLAALLRESSSSATNVIARVLEDTALAHPPRADQRAGLLIVVDQLEELFTTPFADAVRQRFVEVLAALARGSVAVGLPDDAPPILVVATMRSDFFGHLDRLPSLAKLVEGEGQLLLLAPDEHEIGQMIRLPAQLAGLRFERNSRDGVGLDDEILSVAKRDARVLPLLSFVLDQLWQRRTRDGSITFEAYRALGGLEGALARRADEVFDAMPAEVQAALPNLLGALVHVAEHRPDESESNAGASFTARWVELDRFDADSPERRLIDALLEPSVRLLVAEGDRDQVRIRVAHESLLTHWELARVQLSSDRADLVLIERLEAADRLWRDSPESVSADRLLASGLALAEATDLISRRRERLTANLVEFVEASAVAEEERLRRGAVRARRIVSVFAALAFVATLLGLIAWRWGVRASESERVVSKTASDLAAATKAAQESEARATQKSNDVLSLSAIQDLEALKLLADRLWPASPDQLGNYERWLIDAQALVEGRSAGPSNLLKLKPSLQEHEAKLAEIRRRARVRTPDEVEADRRASPSFAELQQQRDGLTFAARARADVGVSTTDLEAHLQQARERVAALESEVDEYRSQWNFQDGGDRWWHDQLQRLVSDLRDFISVERGGLYSRGTSVAHGWGVVQRQEFARSIADRSVSGTEAKRRWGVAIAAVEKSPKYGHVHITPQMGLLPIGADPASGLWEFAHLQTGDEAVRRLDDERLVLTQETGLVFVLIPGGTFRMGAQNDSSTDPNYDLLARPEEGPPREMKLQPYFLSKYEMTQGQWSRFTGHNPSDFGPRNYSKAWNREGKEWNSLHPVERVSWHDCAIVLDRLGLTIPNEAEWEYAARAGTTSVWSTGLDHSSLQDAANVADEYAAAHRIDSRSKLECDTELNDGNSVHAEVGSYRANDYGLHDVHGNVSEWCRNTFESYANSAAFGGGDVHRTDSEPRMRRGGSFDNRAWDARSASRFYNAPENRFNMLGVRPARALQ